VGAAQASSSYLAHILRRAPKKFQPWERRPWERGRLACGNQRRHKMPLFLKMYEEIYEAFIKLVAFRRRDARAPMVGTFMSRTKKT